MINTKHQNKTADTENNLSNNKIDKHEQKTASKNIWIIVIVFLVILGKLGPFIEDDKSLKKYDYVLACQEAIKARLRYPSTYDKDFAGDNVKTYKDYIAVAIWFSAKNAFNLELKYQGTCIIKNGLDVENVLIQEVR